MHLQLRIEKKRERELGIDFDSSHCQLHLIRLGNQIEPVSDVTMPAT